MLAVRERSLMRASAAPRPISPLMRIPATKPFVVRFMKGIIGLGLGLGLGGMYSVII